MKKLLFIFSLAIGISSVSTAQTGKAVNLNEEAVKNYDGVGGHFEYALNARERVNVNYAITPKNPTNMAHFMIHTPEPMPFSATISNAEGKTVYSWKPEQKVYLYKADWNVASLKSGVYTVKIYLDNEPKSIYQFNFSKN